eukprot:gene34336-41564_t
MCLYFGAALASLVEDKNKKSLVGLPKLVVACMLKDEDDIVDYWIDYHASIFGADNILLLDNFSKSPVTKKILLKWQAKGVHVLYEQGPFFDKGTQWVAAARRFRPDSEVFIPLDLD